LFLRGGCFPLSDYFSIRDIRVIRGLKNSQNSRVRDPRILRSTSVKTNTDQGKTQTTNKRKVTCKQKQRKKRRKARSKSATSSQRKILKVVTLRARVAPVAKAA